MLRLGIVDPSGRLAGDLRTAAEHADVELVALAPGDAGAAADLAGLLIAPAVAADLPPAAAGGVPRWVVGDPAHAARVSGAAATLGAAGAILTPVGAQTLSAIARAQVAGPDADLERSRKLIATSLVDLTGAAIETLRAVADAFGAHDCIVWWKDGPAMVPTLGREAPTDGYRTSIAAAARIAAASDGTVLCGGDAPRSVIAGALRPAPTEIAGLVAIVSDTGRRFTAAERTDLKALALRLTRELSWLVSHRRIVAEGERLLATSLHDPLSGAMARGAFEQTIAHEVAAASRRNEKVSLALVDIVGLRKINLEHGHKAGDEVLAQVAARVRATVRGNDALGRPGADELSVLLVGATDQQATLVVRKIIDRIEREPIAVGELGIAVRVRGVITELRPGERSGEAALARCYGGLRAAPIGEPSVVASEPADADSGADTGAMSAGTTLGGTYRVVHELSRGAMGVVYRGEDLGLGRPVAIKVLRSDLASNRGLVSRFRAEAGILASLHHKNLVQVYALGEHAGDVYFVMELVEGQPLSEVLRATLERREWFPVEAIAQIALEIGDALDAMHQAGVIHRDVKPANVLLDRERDRAVLVDVGVAVKAGDQRDAAGTPGFAAPESFLGQDGGRSTDVYGLAATLYCLLTGRPPFGSGSAPQVVQRQLHDPMPPPSQLRSGLSEAVDAVLAKALSPTPKKRWTSASAFAIALGRALDRASGELRVPPAMDESREHVVPPPDMPPAPNSDIAIQSIKSVLEPTAALAEPSSIILLDKPVDRVSEPGFTRALDHSFERTSDRDLARAPERGSDRAVERPSDRLTDRPSDRGERPVISGRVRAAHMRALSRILQHHLGEPGLAKLTSEQPDLAQALSPTLAPLGWVPLELLVAGLGYARDLLPTAAIARKVGRGTMSATFARLFGADPASLPPETVLAALPTFWTRYHDWGEVAAQVGAGTPTATVTLRGYAGSVETCALIAAQLERIVELTGARNAACAHPRCRCASGAAACEFRISWAK